MKHAAARIARLHEDSIIDTDFDAHKTLMEARERHEQGGEHGNRWVPIAAAVLAVVAALVTLLTNQRATESLTAKNEAILATTRAADAYNEYEARSIKQHAYESLVAAGVTTDPKRIAALTSVARHENAAKAPILVRAQNLERVATTYEVRSEKLQHARDRLEIAVTLLEVAIVLISISAVARAAWLPIVAAVAAAGGVVATMLGLA